MNILHVNNYYAERFFYKNLFDRQNEGDVITVVIPVDASFSTSHEYDNYVKILKCYRKMDKYFYFPRLFKVSKSIGRNIDVGSYDIIHAHSLFTNGAIARKVAEKHDLPFIVTIRNVDINYVFRKLFFLRGYGKKLLLSADKVVFLSNSVKEQIISKYCRELPAEKCAVIPNGVDDFWINNKPLFHKSPEKGKLSILYVGDINENKNLIHVAKALEKARRNGLYESVNYTVIGEVKSESVFKELSEYDFVNIRERLEKEKIIDYYRSADIYVMASLGESFGLTYVEAMSQGMPIIYSKNQGFDGQFEEGMVGYHVDPFSEEELIEKIGCILKDYKRLSDNSLALAGSFSWDKVYERFNDLYKELLKNRNG